MLVTLRCQRVNKLVIYNDWNFLIRTLGGGMEFP